MERKTYNLGWLVLLNAFYTLAALVGWPVYLLLLATRRKYRHKCWQRWGFVPKFGRQRQDSSAAPQNDKKGAGQRLWVHAISVGEVEAARTFVPALAAAYPGAEIVLSTTTTPGMERAAKLIPDLWNASLTTWAGSCS